MSNPLEQVGLAPLMELGAGNPEVMIGLIDGPVAASLPIFGAGRIREVSGTMKTDCKDVSSAACLHGTFIAGVLSAKRGLPAPAICPGCALLVRPIFAEPKTGENHSPSATPGELARAIIECVEAGARIINLSVGLSQASMNGERELNQSLDQAALRGVVIVAASGNQGTLGSSAITRHPWLIPVVACDSRGNPTGQSNLGRSIGRRGLRAPGEHVVSLDGAGNRVTCGGTSVAAAFVTGAVALLWSEFDGASATEIKFAVTQSYAPRRNTVVPPLLNAWESYQFMNSSERRRRLWKNRHTIMS
ncbi:MAG TPA: S8 family serine peptidase [Blastocatellia bacterium]|nr:S8 family serine peptidase [Blastocatellia bacterium]